MKKKLDTRFPAASTAAPSQLMDDEEEDMASTSNPSSSQSGSGDSGSEEESPPISSPSSQDVLIVDFEFFDPKPDDFHETRALLKTYLDDVPWDASGFVDVCLSQATVGSVVKTSQDEGPTGIITALNLARYQDCKCMKEVRQYLQKKSVGHQAAKDLEDFWTKKAKDVGLIVSERFVHMIPFELVPPLYDGLFDEVQWATEDEPTQDLRNSFKLKHYLLLTKVFATLPKRVKTSRKQEKQVGTAEEKGDLIFIKAEDEIFLKLSSWSFTFPVKGEASAAHETKNKTQLRLVMGIEAKQIPMFRTLLKGLA